MLRESEVYILKKGKRGRKSTFVCKRVRHIAKDFFCTYLIFTFFLSPYPNIFFSKLTLESCCLTSFNSFHLGSRQYSSEYSLSLFWLTFPQQFPFDTVHLNLVGIHRVAVVWHSSGLFSSLVLGNCCLKSSFFIYLSFSQPSPSITCVH